MEYMYPMDFEEFLMATSSQGLIDEIYNCYKNNMPMLEGLHEKLLNLYRLYLCVGGMPQAVQNIVDVKQNIFDFDKDIIRNIIDSYLNDMNQYILNNTEKSKIEAIYKSIPNQLGNVSNKFQYTKINTNARSRDYESALQWLISSTMIYKCDLLKTIQIPPKAYADEESGIGRDTNWRKRYDSAIFFTAISGTVSRTLSGDQGRCYQCTYTGNTGQSGRRKN